LAVVLPALLNEQRTQKREKLLQYGRRVWGLQHADEERLIDDAISYTRAFFEQMGVPTRLADYGIKAEAVDELVNKLEQHQLLKLGEHGDITLAVSRKILQAAV
jgi:NADP-dependent alcohol dehydrogenase